MGKVFRHPGEMFLNYYPMPRTAEEFASAVRAYVEFLHTEADIPLQPPIDLRHIYDHFGIRLAEQPTGAGRIGFASDSLGLVVVNSEDIPTRARFTQGHELIEFLFTAISKRHPSEKIRKVLGGRKKEQLCDRGASWLLLPPSILAPDVEQFGISLESASVLADQYAASLQATLIGMLGVSDSEHLLVLWRYRLKPSQEGAAASDQLILGETFENRPVKKMRVWWSASSPAFDDRYIAQHQSIGDDSIVAIANASGTMVAGAEYINFGRVKGAFHVEAMPVMIEEERCVVSLLTAQNERVRRTTTRR